MGGFLFSVKWKDQFSRISNEKCISITYQKFESDSVEGHDAAACAFSPFFWKPQLPLHTCVDICLFSCWHCVLHFPICSCSGREAKLGGHSARSSPHTVYVQLLKMYGGNRTTTTEGGKIDIRNALFFCARWNHSFMFFVIFFHSEVSCA